MNDAKNDTKPRTRDGHASDIGVVRVFSNPGPDAEDRLRRLFSLMVRYATDDGATSTSPHIALDRSKGKNNVLEKDSPSQGVPEADN